ncbi:MAG: MBL fold metallo-hydrolase [Phycisphaerales bacterium]
MFFRMIYDEALAQAAYLIGCQKTGEAIVFDPERDIDRYLELALQNNLRIVACAETHIHADFLSGCRELAETIGARVYLSNLGGPDWTSGWLDSKRGGGTYDHVLLSDGDTITIGNIEFRAVHTPGHTPEHMCYLVTDRGSGMDSPMGMVTGDFVFVGDLGRPDLLETAAGVAGAKDESAKELFKSASAFVRSIPEHVQIWPAHGAGSACGKALGAVPQSTAGYEKMSSPALKLIGSESEFTSFILEGQPEPPIYFARMKQQNRDGVPLLGGLPKPRRLDPDELGSIGNKVVVDVRTTDEFRAGHIAGAISSPLGSSFHTSAGAYVDPAEEIVLVVREGCTEQAVREMVRIGLDKAMGYVIPDDLAAFVSGGGTLVATRDASVTELNSKRETDDVFILDVRKATENEIDSIPGAFNKSHTRLPEALAQLPRDRDIYVHCRTGVRSVMACSLLEREGFKPVNVVGGFEAYAAAGHATVSAR